MEDMTDMELAALPSPKERKFSQYDYRAGSADERAANLKQYPRESFVAAVAVLWGYQDADESRIAWKIMAEFRPGQCEEILQALQAVLRRPPDDFVTLLETYGTMQLVREDESGDRGGHFVADDYRAWLRDRVRELRGVLDAVQAEKRADGV